MCAAVCHPSDTKLHPYQHPICYQQSNVNALASSSTVPPPSPPLPASQHLPPQPPPDDVADTVIAQLHGIKVRDFAYENTLPPVTSVPRFSVQVQPRPRTLQRTYKMAEYAGHELDEESDEEDPTRPRTFFIDSSGTGMSRGDRYRKKGAALARTLTEPADDVPHSQGFNTRAQVFTQPSHRPASPRAPPELCTPPRRPTRHFPHSRHLSPIFTEPQSQPSINGESQESGAWVDTPLVTPNGSLQWPVQNTSTLPASQFESVLPQLPDVDVRMSQLGFTPERSQRPYAYAPSESPVWTPSASSSCLQQQPSPAEPQSRTPSPAKSRYSCGSPAPRPPRPQPFPPLLREAPAAPRYDLRRRPPQVARPTAPRATSRVRTSKQAARALDHDASAPPAKKRKVTPPMAATRGRRRNGDVKENR